MAISAHQLDRVSPPAPSRIRTYGMGVVSTLLAGGAITWLATDYKEINNNPPGRTALALLVGMAAQEAFHSFGTAYSKNVSYMWSQVLNKWSYPLFFGITQGDLNSEGVAKVVLRFLLEILPGMIIVNKFHSITGQTLESKVPLIDAVDELDVPAEPAKNRLELLLEPEGRIPEAVSTAIKIAIGVTLIALPRFPATVHSTNLGMFITAYTGGRLAQKLMARAIEKAEALNKETNRFGVPQEQSTLLITLRKINQIGGAIGSTCLGAAFGIPFNASSPQYSLIAAGLITGAEKSSMEEQFRTGELSHAYTSFPYVKQAQKVAHAVNGLLALATIAWAAFILIKDPHPPAQAAIGAFLAGIFALGALPTGIARTTWCQKRETRLANSFQFYFNYYPFFWCLAFLYIDRQMKIGDKVLNQDDLARLIASIFAWLSLGHAVGIRAMQRFPWPYPNGHFHAGDALMGEWLFTQFLK